MTTHVIILCQGQQTRLPGLKIPKQLLELDVPNYASRVTILARTHGMLARVRQGLSMEITIVCGETITSHLTGHYANQYSTLFDGFMLTRGDGFEIVTLKDPGNSSLKGVHQVLAAPKEYERDVQHLMPAVCRRHDRTAILLGDTVYSWKCLLEILAPRPIAFVGTGDLGRSEGEIWGISWNRDQDDVMRRSREAALADHPPAHFTEYQPGQLRRWLWAHCNFDRVPVTPYRDYYEVDDYTRDIDIPAHLDLLPSLARAAYEDDLRESGRLG